MRILFWNMGRNDSASHLAAILAETPCDIVLLCEFSGDSTQLVSRINAEIPGYRELSLPNSSYLRILSNLPTKCVTHISDLNRSSFWTIRVGQASFTLCGCHLASGPHTDLTGRNHLLGRLRVDLRRIEAEVGHDRSIVMGDLNLNPYDEMVVSSEGLHAVSSLKEAKRGPRQVQGENCPYFYNPMWSHLGDRSPGPAGTYFWQCSQPSGYGWNMLDQILFRPSLMKSFDDFKVDILTMAGKNSLLTKNGRPKKAISDHLPLRIHLVTGQTP